MCVCVSTGVGQCGIERHHELEHASVDLLTGHNARDDRVLSGGVEEPLSTLVRHALEKDAQTSTTYCCEMEQLRTSRLGKLPSPQALSST